MATCVILIGSDVAVMVEMVCMCVKHTMLPEQQLVYVRCGHDTVAASKTSDAYMRYYH